MFVRCPALSIPARRRLFRLLAATLMPLCFFALLEFILWVFGVGYSSHFIVKAKTEQGDAYVENRHFGRRFFPPALVRSPVNFSMARPKQAGTYRIFILGESAAMGDPDWTFAFGRVLETMLRARYPRTRFEVINAAMVAINSHVIREIARDCARCQPDLFILYIGHNEVVGPYGPGTVFRSLSASRGLIHTDLLLRSTRTAQMLESIAGSLGVGTEREVTWRGMEMFLDLQISAGDPRLPIVYEHLRANLRDILASARRSGARVIACTTSSNLRDCAPFASLHRQNLSRQEREAWERFASDGMRFEADGDPRQALDCFHRAEQIDDQYAGLHFRIGGLYQQMGDATAAREYYLKARDRDALRFRADSWMNKITREVVEQDGPDPKPILVDAEQVFERVSPGGVPGRELFLDHVHLSFHGNYLLAREVLAGVEQTLPGAVRAQSASEKPIPSEEDCGARLALTDWDRCRLAEQMAQRLRRPPFAHQLGNAPQLEILQADIERLRESVTTQGLATVAAQYDKAIALNPQDWVLRFNDAQLLDALDQPREAAGQLRQVLQSVPQHPAAWNGLAEALRRQGRLGEAAQCLARARAIDPRNAETYNTLALVRLGEGKKEEAGQLLRRALAIDQASPKALNNLGNLCEEKGEVARAVELYQKAIACAPDFALGYANLGLVMIQQGRIAEAVTPLKKVVLLQPDNVEAHTRLAAVFSKLQHWPQAGEHWRAASLLRPGDNDLRQQLADAMKRAKETAALPNAPQP